MVALFTMGGLFHSFVTAAPPANHLLSESFLQLKSVLKVTSGLRLWSNQIRLKLQSGLCLTFLDWKERKTPDNPFLITDTENDCSDFIIEPCFCLKSYIGGFDRAERFAAPWLTLLRNKRHTSVKISTDFCIYSKMEAVKAWLVRLGTPQHCI